ncbi:MAG: polyprenyl synthetase family protein [Chloroflexi bacterium]|nr:polyprenyl synthetase family protein [Chloroflexota bacterium]
MERASIYEPVREELLEVEAGIQVVAKADFPWLGELLSHILKNSGKRLRPTLTLLAGKFHRYDASLLVPMATGVELFHTATLVHDDTIDNSVVRRGHPTLNSLWNGGTAVLVGDYLFAQAAALVIKTGNQRVTQLFAQILGTVCRGELRQVSSAYDWHPMRQHYFDRIGDKTASVFAAATEAGAILSQAPEIEIQALKNYGYQLGMAFQIVDDILDFMGESKEMGKPVANDLLQGTLTLPAILLLERYPEGNPILQLFAKQGQEANLQQAIQMIRSSTIIRDSYQVAEEFCAQARQSLDGLADGPHRRSLLELVDYVIQRMK